MRYENSPLLYSEGLNASQIFCLSGKDQVLHCVAFQANHPPSQVTDISITHFSEFCSKNNSRFSGCLWHKNHVFLKKWQMSICILAHTGQPVCAFLVKEASYV